MGAPAEALAPPPPPPPALKVSTYLDRTDRRDPRVLGWEGSGAGGGAPPMAEGSPAASGAAREAAVGGGGRAPPALGGSFPFSLQIPSSLSKKNVFSSWPSLASLDGSLTLLRIRLPKEEKAPRSRLPPEFALAMLLAPPPPFSCFVSLPLASGCCCCCCCAACGCCWAAWGCCCCC